MDFFDFVKTNKILILILSVIINIILSILLIYFYLNDFKKMDCNINNNNNNNNPVSEISDENSSEEFYVEVKGAVKKPGVYKLNNDSIINDLITLAGGFNKNAYTKNINLSRKVTKELVVYVYTSNEYKKQKENNTVYLTKEIIKEVPCECSTYDLTNCTDNLKSEIVASEKDSIFEPKEDISQNSSSNLVNINTATLEQLQSLPGIGASKAQDIIDYRTKNGLFKDISDIKNVSGIGNALYEKIKSNITI